MVRHIALLVTVVLFIGLLVHKTSTIKVKNVKKGVKDNLKDTAGDLSTGESPAPNGEGGNDTDLAQNNTGTSDLVDNNIIANNTNGTELADDSDLMESDDSGDKNSKGDGDNLGSIVKGVGDVVKDIADEQLPSVTYFISNILSKLRGVEPSLVPVHEMSDTLDLFIDVKILSLTSFDEISGEVALVSSMKMRWDTTNTPRWDPITQLKGKMAVPIDSNLVWRPQLLLLNPANDVQDLTQLSDKMRLMHNGTIEWNIVSSIQASCTVDISYFPFDTQLCTINIATWGYTSSEINIIGSFQKADVPFFRENSVWALLDLKLETGNEADVAFITISLYFKRHWQFFMINILLAPVLLSFLSPCVFLLPASSGERISFSITCFLAFGVFSSLLADNIPRSSSPVARLCYLLMSMTLQSFGVAFCTILSLRMYNVDDGTTVPSWIHTFLMLLRRKRVDSETDDHVNDCLNLETRRLTINTIAVNDEKLGLEKLDGHGVDAQIDDTSVGESDKDVSWRDIARIMDYIFFVVFTGSMLTSMIVAMYSLFN